MASLDRSATPDPHGGAGRPGRQQPAAVARYYAVAGSSSGLATGSHERPANQRHANRGIGLPTIGPRCRAGTPAMGACVALPRKPAARHPLAEDTGCDLAAGVVPRIAADRTSPGDGHGEGPPAAA